MVHDKDSMESLVCVSILQGGRHRAIGYPKRSYSTERPPSGSARSIGVSQDLSISERGRSYPSGLLTTI